MRSLRALMGQDAVIEWLLAGDPAIRWQVLRDLLDAPTEEWEAERARTVEEGWVAELLQGQDADGEWPKGGGPPRDGRSSCSSPAACRSVIRPRASRWSVCSNGSCRRARTVDGAFLLRRVDLCHLGFWLGIVAYFLPEDPRIRPLGEAVLAAQRGRRLELPDAQLPGPAAQLLQHDVQRPREPPDRGRAWTCRPRMRSRRPSAGRSSSCSSTGSTAPTRPAR